MGFASKGQQAFAWPPLLGLGWGYRDGNHVALPSGAQVLKGEVEK